MFGSLQQTRPRSNSTGELSLYALASLAQGRMGQGRMGQQHLVAKPERVYQAMAGPGSGLLVRLNLTTGPAGVLQIRLTTVDRTGNYPELCVVRVRAEKVFSQKQLIVAYIS